MLLIDKHSLIFFIFETSWEFLQCGFLFIKMFHFSIKKENFEDLLLKYFVLEDIRKKFSDCFDVKVDV